MRNTVRRRRFLGGLLTVVLAALPGSPGTAQSRRPLATRGVSTDLVCGPQASLTAPSTAIRVAGGAERAKTLFAPGDVVIINAGSAQGLQAGQRFYARRVIEDRFTVKTTEKPPFSIHTAGWLTIVDVQATTSTATISEACDGVVEGDYLAPFVLPPPAGDVAAGEPDFERPARLILADDRRQVGGGDGSLMVIDRGSDHGLRAGQRLTIFRRTLDGAGPVATIGRAVVVSTQFETSTIRVDASREAVQVGDLVAIHRAAAGR